MNPFCIELAGGEALCLQVIEIKAVPDVSITVYSSENEAVAAQAESVCRALQEIFRIYKASHSSGLVNDISIETLWMTEPVVNQTYAARIRIFLLFRAISDSAELCQEVLGQTTAVFINTLESAKYDLDLITYEQLEKALGNVNRDRTLAITKESRIDQFQIPTLPQCFSYDRLNAEVPSMEATVHAMIRHPNVIVSYQLLPTSFTTQEQSLLDSTAQALGMLSRGMHDPGWGMVVFETAQHSYDTYSYYSGQKNNPLFLCNTYVRGSSSAVSEIASSVRQQISGSNSLGLNTIALESPIEYDQSYAFAPWIISEELIKRSTQKLVGVSSICARLPFIITAEEAVSMFVLPIGGAKIKAGITINEAAKDSKTYAGKIVDAGDITVGKLKASSGQNEIGLSLKDLTKHMLIVGAPGSGKTTFSVSLLDRLWKEHGIPFLVIEPAKNEYRALVQSIPDLQVFTPGKNFVSPFVFNPFVPPEKVRLESYKTTLKTAFAAGVSMTTPLDKIFEESINNCYSDFKWLDTYTSEDGGEVFNIADFIKCFQKTFDDVGYTGDARNIGRAGTVRLNSFANLFDNYYSIPIKDMMTHPTVVELSAVENQEQKALIIALLLLSILAYVNANYVGEGQLKNVLLLEEAHVLLDPQNAVTQAETNPGAVAQGLIKRMLAEIRAYGVGIVIADQSPKKVTSDVVGLTDIKMVFRLVESADKQIIKDSTNMSDVQVQRMSKLRPGEAFLFWGKLDEPEEVITPDYRLENNISISLSDESIQKLSTYWNDKQDKLRPYPECGYVRCCNSFCDYKRRILAREIARRIFVKNFGPKADWKTVQKVFGQISAWVKHEINNEPFSEELLLCVKTHLWRRIKYNTSIHVPAKTVESSLTLLSKKKEG